MLNRDIQKKKNGFTLVEMLVSIAVFMVVVTTAVGALYSIIDANRKAQAIKNVINNVSFALESISRDMRMGKEYFCADPDTGIEVSCESTGNAGVKYTSDILGKDVWYSFKTENLGTGGGNIQRGYKNLPTDPVVWESLTAPESTVKIKNMVFYIINKDGNGNDAQPRVIITVEGESGTKESIKTNFSLQTTISQRAIEI